ncbi:MAG: hypothetical protein ACR2JE_08295 [Acidobacteriaceae bacterium]
MPNDRELPNDHELDELLDAALTRYVDEEPEVGLSARVLARARQVELVPARRWYWLSAAPALALLLIIIVLVNHSQTPRGGTASLPSPQVAAVEVTPPDVKAKAQDAPPSSVKPQRTGRRVVLNRSNGSRAGRAPEAKQAQFPTPAPLTAEETALIAFATEHPKQALEQIAMARQALEPLQTAAVQIEPLRITPLGQGVSTSNANGPPIQVTPH